MPGNRHRYRSNSNYGANSLLRVPLLRAAQAPGGDKLRAPGNQRGVIHRRQTAQHLHEVLFEVGYAKDIVVATVSDIERHRNNAGLVYAEALAAGAQVYWYQMIVAGIEDAQQVVPDTAPAGSAPEIFKEQLLEVLRSAKYEFIAGESQTEDKRCDITAAGWSGHAHWHGISLTRLNLRPDEP